MSDLACMAFEIRQEEGRRSRTIFVASKQLRESLLKVARGEELDVIWIGGQEAPSTTIQGVGLMTTRIYSEGFEEKIL